MASDATLSALVATLEQSQNILFITGAGVSADSGLPTYRGIGGLYNEEDTDDGMPIEEALSGRVLLKDMHLTWKHIGRIEAACRGAGFNRAHEVMALFEERFDRVCVLTQNVDGFHQAAGSKNVIPIH
ncbi:MAG: Sir2 family NAD-dependent protein deacetylase, partial [Myxococcota bacterium]|nr:Sir2 family NAD-dependent protein deacetylase [Myxococcota bacterium]